MDAGHGGLEAHGSLGMVLNPALHKHPSLLVVWINGLNYWAGIEFIYTLIQISMETKGFDLTTRHHFPSSEDVSANLGLGVPECNAAILYDSVTPEAWFS